MSQTKVQLIAPIGVVTATTLETTGVLTATTFVGDIAGTVTGITSTTDNLNLGIVTAVSYTHLRAPRDRTRSRMPSSA